MAFFIRPSRDINYSATKEEIRLHVFYLFYSADSLSLNLTSERSSPKGYRENPSIRIFV